MIKANTIYLEWLNKIKLAVYSIINNVDINDNFDPWEQALIIAKCCHLLNTNPANLKWSNSGCSTDENNVYLKIIFKD